MSCSFVTALVLQSMHASMSLVLHQLIRESTKTTITSNLNCLHSLYKPVVHSGYGPAVYVFGSECVKCLGREMFMVVGHPI